MSRLRWAAPTDVPGDGLTVMDIVFLVVAVSLAVFLVVAVRLAATTVTFQVPGHVGVPETVTLLPLLVAVSPGGNPCTVIVTADGSSELINVIK